jgi:hypothetical protein
MKITIEKIMTDQLELTDPTFRADKYNVYKIYETNRGPVYDQVGRDTYLRGMTWNFNAILNDIANYHNTTIEHYSAELERFVLSVVQDQNSLFEDDPIKRVESLVECHSELER